VDMKDEVSDITILASFAEDLDNVVMQAYAAPASWLDENKDTAIAFCATVLKANEALAADFDLFKEAADRFMPEPPAAEVLQTTFDLITAGRIWPADLTNEAVDYTV